MGATWNRDVKVVSGACENGTETHHLEVSLSQANANPPDHPNDKADQIHVSTADRTGANGAQVIYHAKTAGLELTGITPDNQPGLSPAQRGNGETLVLSDTGGKGVTYTYAVLGSYDGKTLHTCDPQIHNEDD